MTKPENQPSTATKPLVANGTRMDPTDPRRSLLTPDPVPPPAHLVGGRVRLGPLTLASRFTMAPLAGYTNLPFRLVVRELGGIGLATTDLVNGRALMLASAKTLDLIQTCAEDRPFAVQIYGGLPHELAEAARHLVGLLGDGLASIDINMGCPVHKITKGGGGSAMLCQVGNAVALVRAVVEAVPLPVTVKMRLGWDAKQITAPELAREFEQVGVAGLTIHGRTREQGFSGGVDVAGIRSVVQAVERIPVLGNGDVRTLTDAANMLRETGCSGLALGRGALLNPWIFHHLARWDATGDPGDPPTYIQRLEFMIRHFERLLSIRDERFACLTFRKMAGWYCKMLRPGREIQQGIVMLESQAHFNQLCEQMRPAIESRDSHPWHEAELPLNLPAGPIAHW
ncbi:MAG: tRNA dihydrouridine synthase DusB [Planctomycetota bacterium]|nr:tRNA dihydrouridine synthase DusB [Planctomycetota bacterium]